MLLLLGGLNIIAIDRIAGPAAERYGLTATIGAGLWLTAAAGLASSAIGLLATIRTGTRLAPPSRWDAPQGAPYA